jgi:hypothetical protein
MLHKKVNSSKIKETLKKKSEDVDKINIKMRCFNTYKNEYIEEVSAEEIKKQEE